MSFAGGCAWIDGEYVPIAEARIPILDAGFVRSDLTYDVAGVWGGRFFRLDAHLDRLERGCERIRLRIPVPRAQLEEILHGVVSRSGLREAYVEAVVTRGVPGPGERDPRKWTPRLYCYAIPYVWIVGPELQERGTDVVVARDVRGSLPGRSIPP
jgi:branched-chain amino acid aminotransferase